MAKPSESHVNQQLALPVVESPGPVGQSTDFAVYGAVNYTNGGADPLDRGRRPRRRPAAVTRSAGPGETRADPGGPPHQDRPNSVS